MSLFPSHVRLQYDPSDRKAFRTRRLWKRWADEFPELFDADDLRLARSQAHLGYHFFEWLGAIRIYQFYGYLSLVEKYQFKKHKRKRRLFEQLAPVEVVRLFTSRSGKARGQAPDLLVYKPDLTDWFFCEVKGDRDRIRPSQEADFSDLEALLGEPVRVLEFRPTVTHARER